jgi:transcriptional regulator ATRX
LQRNALFNLISITSIAEELDEVVPIQETAEESAWWSKFVEKEHFEDLRISTKLVLLFGILKESEQIGDKV